MHPRIRSKIDEYINESRNPISANDVVKYLQQHQQCYDSEISKIRKANVLQKHQSHYRKNELLRM